MSMNGAWRNTVSLAMLGLVASLASLAAAQETPLRVPMQRVELRAPNVQGDVLFQVGHEPKYWVGVFCRPLDDSLRTQLKVPAEQGVVIDGVAPDSPAEKAGLQRHDVLITVGETALKNPVELMKLVDEAGEKELAFEVIRGGKKLTLKVTPAARPQAKEENAFQIPRQNLDTLRLWIDKLDDPAHGPLHLRGFGPAVMFGARQLPQLPDGVSIQINKTGSEPAKVVVTRGDEKWELTDTPEELKQLPDDLRPAVEALLGHNSPFQVRVPGPSDAVGSVKPLPEGKAKQQPSREADMEQRLQKLEHRLEQLLNELEGKAKGE